MSLGRDFLNDHAYEIDRGAHPSDILSKHYKPNTKMAIQLKSTAKAAAMTWKKICIHGQAGIGKTMLAATAAPFKPLIILTERTGEESLQPASIEAAFGKKQKDIVYDLDYIEAYDPASFEEAVNFALSSDHDLVIFDSFSKASRLILKAAKINNAHGMKAYGEHNDVAIGLVESLMEQNKHVVCICHTSRQQDGESGEILYIPNFEGKSFAEKFLYELAHCLHMEKWLDDEGTSHRVLRAHKGDSDKFAKNRGGRLSEIEQPHLGRLIFKLEDKKYPLD